MDDGRIITLLERRDRDGLTELWKKYGTEMSSIAFGICQGRTEAGEALNETLAGSLITEITLPDSLVTIGDGVFQDCYGLEKLIIPAGVETVGVFRWSPYYLRLPAKEVTFLSPDTRLAVKDGVYVKYLDSDRSGIVVAYANSDAAIFANAFGLKFVEIQ